MRVTAMLKPKSFLAQCQMIANELHKKCGHLLFTAHDDKTRPEQYASIKVENLETGHSDHDCRLNLFVDTQTNRIVITGNKPKSLDNTTFPSDSETWPQKITVSSIRSASAIAGEICKRLLDPYLGSFPDAAAERDLHDEAATNINERGHEIANLIGGTISIDRIKNGGPGEEFGHVREIYISNETVSLNLTRIPFDLAKEMLRVWMHGGKHEQIREFGQLTQIGFLEARRIIESASEASSALTKAFAETESDMNDFWLSAAHTASTKLNELAKKLGFTVEHTDSNNTYYLVKGDEMMKIPTFDE
jgi:hypothetical protein